MRVIDLRGQLPTRPGASPYPKRSLALVTDVDLHYTASASDVSVEAIARYQTGPGAQEPFPAIAYHFMVDGHGRINRLHDLDVRVWHNGGYRRNDIAVGICYIGNREPNPAQQRWLRETIRLCERELGRSLAVHGHKDSAQTICPGSMWPSWRAAVLP